MLAGLSLAGLSLTGCVPQSEEPVTGAAQATTGQSFNAVRAQPPSPARYAEACEQWDEWAKPAPPFQIMGNSYYVGTCGIAAILVTGAAGHVLIDSGVPEAGPLVLANIRALGFDPSDVRYILMSHEHFDHVGAHATLAEETGAQVVASPEAAPVLERGTVSPEDPQFAVNHPPMVPTKVAKIVQDQEVIKLGDLELTAHLTPGHSPGAMSWTWWTCSLPGEPPVCRRIAYVDSLSAVSAEDYRFSDHPQYLGQFRDSIDKVRFLPCDYIVTPHPSASGLIAKLRDGTFGQPGGCQAYADRVTKALDARLDKEAETTAAVQ